MPEHRIRLRAAWDCVDRLPPEGGPEDLGRVDLPKTFPEGFPPRFRLTRQFGRPPVDERAERVDLELRSVPGLVSVRLNGRVIGRPDESGASADWSIPLDPPLLPRNGLVLEVELTTEGRANVPGWGEIALVIRPRDRPA